MPEETISTKWQADRDEADRKLVRVVPSERQIAFQQVGFYAFIHFSVNTYTDKEWGDGTEPGHIFLPERFDPDQWVESVGRPV